MHARNHSGIVTLGWTPQVVTPMLLRLGAALVAMPLADGANTKVAHHAAEDLCNYRSRDEAV